jgi:LCP family protein required for cell wall assembly
MNRKNNIDGFVLRRRSQNSDLSRQRPSLAGSRAVPERFLIDPTKGIAEKNALRKGAPMLQRTAGPAALTTDESLTTLPAPVRGRLDLNDLNIDGDTPAGKPDKKSKKDRKRRGGRKWSRKKIIITVSSLLAVCLLIFAGYFAYKFLSTGGKIFKGNVITALFDQGQPLKQDANGRSNILLFGTSEDDPGHPAGDLTDSLMVVSVNQKTHDAFLVSIPRDLHVQYGQACISGYQGKINVLYNCAKENNAKSEDAGAAALRSKIGEIFGLDVQYSAHVNYTVMKQAVDAVGGITVDIQGDDPRGILDRNFDWMCNFKCYYVKWPNGPAQLDGVHALALARARGDVAPTYGLSRSNPDREDNQRKIIIALKDKAVTAGVLTNPVAVNNLLDALGDNLRTNFDAGEIKTLIDIGKNVKNDDITSFSLENTDKPLATASCFSGDICPNAGSFSYGPIQTAISALATGDKASLEYAKIDVLNASGTPGTAQTKADELAAKNLTISSVGNAPTTLGDKPIKFYDMTGGKKPATLKKLKGLLGVDVTAGTPAGVTTGADFVVVVGAQPAPAAAKQ